MRRIFTVLSRPRLVLVYLIVCLGLLVTSSNQTQAAINTTGDINPAYNNSDPWEAGINLRIGQTGTGTLTIDGSSEVNGTYGYLGDNAGSNGTATVTGTGSIWSNSFPLTVGNSGAGTLNIYSGGTVNNSHGYLGYEVTGVGTATISGPDSTWNNDRNLFIGLFGTGTLNIENNGVVDVADDTWVGRWLPNASGTINFNDGTLNTGGLLASHDELLGSGTINTSTIVSDIDLVFDATHGLQQQFILDNLPGQNITINLDASPSGSSRSMGAGYRGTGSLTIADGLSLRSKTGYLGFGAGSNGTATIDGAGSTWNINNGQFTDRVLYVGNEGNGTLSIENGGVVSDFNGYIGHSPAATGTATVSGPGSAWNNTSNLTVGFMGTGTLIIEDAGTVNGNYGRIGLRTNATGTVTVTGTGSIWNSELDLTVGHDGTATLNIEDNGVVEVAESTWVARGTTGTGMIHFNNGVLNTTNLYASSSDLGGVGTINTKGIVSDVELVFDATHGLQQQIVLNSIPGQNITINLDASDPANTGTLGAGYAASGSLLINDSMSVVSGKGEFGSKSGSIGTATVSGPGSTWDVGRLQIGVYGHGILNITDGGVVNGGGTLGEQTGSSGTATVSGPGSIWNGNTRVGLRGSATLNIENGGVVTGGSGEVSSSVGSTGTANISGPDSAWINTGTLTVSGEGTSTLNISNGGTADNFTSYIGLEPNSSGAVAVTGANSTWNISGGLSVGYEGNGTLNVENGGGVNVTSETSVGKGTTGSGSLYFNNGTLNTASLLAAASELRGVGTINTRAIISDIDLVFDASSGPQQQIVLNSLPGQNIVVNLDASDPTNTGSLGAGYRGTGNMMLADGQSVTSDLGALGYHLGAIGTATVMGTGSTWNSNFLYVGHYGEGALNIESGGEVNSGTSGYLGAVFGSTGTANVSGPGSVWNSNGFIIGAGGTGTLHIENGGVANSTYAHVGSNGSSTGTVNISGPGSTWNNSGILNIGKSGAGNLNIQNAGLLNSNNSYIGQNAGKDSSATVGGAGSMWINTGFLAIGFNNPFADSTLNIENDGLVSVGGDVTLGASGGNGIINLSGGKFKMNGGNLLGGQGTALFNFTGGTFEGVSTIDLGQPWIQYGGTLAPGNSIGQTDIIGPYDLTAGTVEIELGGPSNPHDLVTATGDIDIALTGTTLDLPALGMMAAGTYSVIESTGGTITGTFEHITGLGIHPGLIDVNYSSNALTVTLNWDYLPGDLNGDGFVGIDDLNTILTTWNQNVTPGLLAAGDITGDGFIGIGDLTAVLANWNTGTPPPPAALNAIPEPAAVGLVGLGMTCLGHRRQCVRPGRMP